MNPASRFPRTNLSWRRRLACASYTAVAKGFALCAVGLSSFASAEAADKPAPQTQRIELKLGTDSSLKLEGSSTLHPYSSGATVFRFSTVMEVPEAEADRVRTDPAEALRAGYPVTGTLRVEVAGLKSGDRALDGNLRNTLKEKQHPEIVFRLERYEADTPSSPAPDEVPVRLFGKLTVAGRERPVTVHALAKQQAGALHISGSKELLMTDFGVSPPTFFVVVKTDDRVVVRFNLSLKAAPQLRSDAGPRRAQQ